MIERADLDEFSEKLQLASEPPCPRFGKLCCTFCNKTFRIGLPPFPKKSSFSPLKITAISAYIQKVSPGSPCKLFWIFRKLLAKNAKTSFCRDNRETWYSNVLDILWVARGLCQRGYILGLGSSWNPLGSSNPHWIFCYWQKVQGPEKLMQHAFRNCAQTMKSGEVGSSQKI